MAGVAQANVVGALLLIVVVIGLWCLVWLWVHPALEAFKGEYPEARLSELSAEYVIVEDVWVVGSECRIYVYNAGEVEVVVSAVYINHKQAWKGELKLYVGEGKWLVVQMPQGESAVRELKVVTARGGEYYWGG